MKVLFDWDYKIFELLNGLAGKNVVFDYITIFFAHYYVFIFPLLALVYYILHQEKYSLLQVGYSQIITIILSRGIITELIRYFYKRPRPFLVHNVTQLIYKYPEASFPSGHTLGIVAAGMALWFFDQKLAWFVMGSGVVVGFFRIVAGVHYPLDVLVGVILAFPSALVGNKLFRYFIK